MRARAPKRRESMVESSDEQTNLSTAPVTSSAPRGDENASELSDPLLALATIMFWVTYVFTSSSPLLQVGL